MIKAVVFDFGGVIADEGFREGLKSIASQLGRDEQAFFDQAADLVFDSGYVTGKIAEHQYWELVRRNMHVDLSSEFMRECILDRFLPRDWMIALVKRLRSSHYTCAILSDQTQWLDELDAKYGFFRHFDAVFNSFYLGLSKKDPQVFTVTAEKLALPPEQIVFVDDNPANVERAEAQGLRGIVYKNQSALLIDLRRYGVNSDVV